ncbi:MAG: SURF1 family protein [Caulobacteraceae bacterium]
MKRFPLGLTIASAVAFLVLLGLGAWQLQRLRWKEGILSRIAELRHAPRQAIGPVLARLSVGADVEFTRVEAQCEPSGAPSPAVFRYALRGGAIGWRLMTVCRLRGGPYDGILLDRGLVQRFAGAMAPGPLEAPGPGSVIGILRAPGARPLLGGEKMSGPGGPSVVRVVDADALRRIARGAGITRPAPYVLAVEREAPPARGIIPAPLPESIPNNHLAYALTWFGLAIVLAWMYGAFLVRRRP